MTTPRQMEPNVNIALGNLLKGMMPTCTVLSEHTNTFPDHPGRHADVLVTATGRSPVTVEAEFEPAPEAEDDARERLGLKVNGEVRTVEASVAVRYPLTLETAANLPAALREATLSYCVLSIDRRSPTPDREIQSINRFPESGWLEGSVEDLADLVRLVSAPRLDVENAADALQGGIDRVATILEEMERSRPAVNATIANILGLDNVPQTRRMAGAILANALVFHEHIAGRHQEIKPVAQVCGPQIGNPQSEALDAWAKILKINYWPIFGVASEILSSLTAAEAKEILNTLQYTVGEFALLGLENAHNLTGRVFQRLISDRKYLATFYTLPESAALLARLAVAQLDGVNWSDREAIGKLRIGDFACGTGALLSAVYEQVAARHERAGGDLEKLHSVMLEEVLYGYDVLPSAVHISAATLAGAQPKVGFRKTHLDSLPYGRLSDGSVAIGSLEFLKSNSQLTFSNFSDPARRVSGEGEHPTAHSIAEAHDNSFDLVIMNPPFTRAGSDWEGEERSQDAVKQFRGMSTDLQTQREMASREKSHSKDTCAHGYAGIASTFAALAHRKLKPGGVLALVLPLSASGGMSWRMFREMLASEYTDLSLFSIAAADNDQLSFSADTDIAECLVLCRKLKRDEKPAGRIQFASLTGRPEGPFQSVELAKKILNSGGIRRLEDGPYDGTRLELGSESHGAMLTAPCPADGEAWAGTRIEDYSLAQTAFALSHSRLWLPGMAESQELKVALLNDVGKRGFYDMNIVGNGNSSPFTKTPPSATATYPSLWNHAAKNETLMVCVPDSQLQVKQRMEEKAAAVWATASRGHLNRDFRFNSQPLTAAFTDRNSVGGRAWPNVYFSDDKFDFAFMVWCNSTFGLLSYWWHANRQVAGRGTTTISSIETLPVLDFRTLTHAQLTKAEEIFEEFRDKELMPAYLADADPNRALLDRRVICDLLGFDESVYEGVRRLAAKWCAEPSVHGGKPRPETANFVM